MPEKSIPKEAAYQIINDELMLDGRPRLNLASFVTTWMEPECDKLVMASINKNYVDMDEYPVTTELQNRCVNMISHLFNAPVGEDETAVGVGTVGSSEAIMLAVLAFKRKWQQKRKLEGKPYDKPNIVTGANVQGLHADGAPSSEADEHILRVIMYEDVNEYLFSLSSYEARVSLVSQFIDIFGGKISQWICTNSTSWIEKILSLDKLLDSLLEPLRRVHDVLSKSQSNPGSSSLEILLGSTVAVSKRTDMMKFLRNAILLCLTAFPNNYVFEEAALVAEELSVTKMNSSSYSVTPCRALAKSLLKSDRQREAFYGNIDYARRVFDMALLSIEGLPLELQSKVPLLYFWYAEVELANSPGDGLESSSRALHILYCLGSGGCLMTIVTSNFLTCAGNILRKQSLVMWVFALAFEISRGGSQHRIHGLFERALANSKTRNSVLLWRCYIGYEINVACNLSAARRIFFRAIHACPWSKKLWLDGFLKLNQILSAKELSDLQEAMRDKELNLRTDIYEILLQDQEELVA